MTQSRISSHQSFAIMASLVCFGLMISGCTGPRGILPNNLEDDLRERHHIKEQSKAQSLAVIPVGSNHDIITFNDVERVQAFIDAYKHNGLGRLTIHYAGSQAAQPAMSALLKELNPAHIITTTGNARLGMAEIQLSYTATEAVLDQDCQGRHTEGGMTTMVPNKTMGCAMMFSFAQQISDPREISEPHAIEKRFTKANSVSNGSKSTDEAQGNDIQNKASQLISTILK